MCAHRSGIRLSLSGLAVLVERTASAPSGSESVVALTTDRDKQGWGATGRLLRRSCCRTKLRGVPKLDARGEQLGMRRVDSQIVWSCSVVVFAYFGVASHARNTGNGGLGASGLQAR